LGSVTRRKFCRPDRAESFAADGWGSYVGNHAHRPPTTLSPRRAYAPRCGSRAASADPRPRPGRLAGARHRPPAAPVRTNRAASAAPLPARRRRAGATLRLLRPALSHAARAARAVPGPAAAALGLGGATPAPGLA